MLRRALASTLLISGVVLPLTLPFACHHSLPLGLLATGLTFLVHATLAYGTFLPNSRLFGPLITTFPAPGNREVWLTIDDGPDPYDTPRLLDLLDASDHARATFFVTGDRVRAYPDLIHEILRRGHTLGNHTDTHPQASFWRLGPARLRREISGCQNALRTLTGSAPRFFRAPVGMINPCVPAVVRACGLETVGWSARGFDGISTARPDDVVRRILADLRPGGIVLLHEGKRSPVGDPLNVRVLKKLLPALRERGWQAVLPPVSS